MDDDSVVVLLVAYTLVFGYDFHVFVLTCLFSALN